MEDARADIERLAGMITDARREGVFTGAGISTESGIPDFRSPTGIWSQTTPIYYQEFLACQRRLKIRPKGGAKDCHLGWWSDVGVRLGVGDAARGFFGGSGQRSHAKLKRSASAGRPQGGMVYRVGVGLATRASEARCRPGPGDGVPQFSYRHCFCGRGFG